VLLSLAEEEMKRRLTDQSAKRRIFIAGYSFDRLFSRPVFPQGKIIIITHYNLLVFEGSKCQVIVGEARFPKVSEIQYNKSCFCLASSFFSSPSSFNPPATFAAKKKQLKKLFAFFDKTSLCTGAKRPKLFGLKDEVFRTILLICRKA